MRVIGLIARIRLEELERQLEWLLHLDTVTKDDRAHPSDSQPNVELSGSDGGRRASSKRSRQFQQTLRSFLDVFVLVVAAPPLVRLALRVSGGRVLPLLLSAERCQVEEGPHAAKRLDAAGRREVRAKNAVAVTEEDAEAERFAVLVCIRLRRLRRDPEVDVEVAVERREPWDRPTQALPVRGDLCERGAGHECKRRVPGVQVGEVADLVGEHRAAVAAGV